MRRSALTLALLTVIPGGVAAGAGGTFIDDDGSVHEGAIEALVAEDVTKGCGPNRFCPDETVTRGQMAALLQRALPDLPVIGSASFSDSGGSPFEADIAWLASTGVTRGCNPPDNTRFCPEDPVTRGQMAAFLVRALGYLDGAGSDRFADDDGSVFETDIERLAHAGVTLGCGETRFCPDDPVTRAQMASFLTRALDYPIPELEPDLVMRPDGLGPGLAFGSDGGMVTDVLSAHLGPPTSSKIEDYVLLDEAFGVFPYGNDPELPDEYFTHPFLRMDCWTGLCAHHGSFDGERWEFVFWRVSEPGTGLTTDDGLSVGSLFDDLYAAYPSLTLEAGEGGSVGFQVPGWESTHDGAVMATGRLGWFVNPELEFGRPEVFPGDVPDGVVLDYWWAGRNRAFACC